MLEKKRQLLQRELEKQMAVDGGAAVSLDISAIAPGSSAKSLKATLLPTQVQPGKSNHHVVYTNLYLKYLSFRIESITSRVNQF